MKTLARRCVGLGFRSKPRWRRGPCTARPAARCALKALSVLAVVGSFTACSTSFWYLQFQAAQYEKCDKLASAEDRRRCKAETYPDEEKYKKERAAAKGASN